MKVYYSGNFWGNHKFERAGKEIRIKKDFLWGGIKWNIPAIYSCSKGLVIEPKNSVYKTVKRVTNLGAW